MKLFRKNSSGVVLLTVLCLMSMLTIVLMTSIVIVSSSSKKAVVNYTDNQVYATAKSSLDTFVDCLADKSMTSFNSMRTKVENLAVGSELVVDVTSPSGEADKIIIKKESSGKTVITAKSTLKGNSAQVSREIEVTQSVKATKTDIIFVFDASTSMANKTNNITGYDIAVNAARDFANQLLVTNPKTKGNVRIGLSKFGTQAHPDSSKILDLTNDYNAIQNKLQNGNSIKYKDNWGGDQVNGTNITYGLITATEMLKNSTADVKIIILLGDGLPTFSQKVTHWGTSATDPFTFGLPGSGVNTPGSWGSWQYYPDNNRLGDGIVYNINSYTVNGRSITNNKLPAVCAAENARFKGYKVMTIGFGLNALPHSDKGPAIETLKEVADSPDYYYSADKSAESMKSILDSIVSEVASSVSGGDYIYAD